MRNAEAMWDGDQGPIFERVIMDGDSPRDFASAAAEMWIEDEDGNLVARRAAVVSSTKASGKVRVYFRGLETDWDGLGRNLILKPRYYYATAPDGTPATNLLSNASFDVDATPADGIADGWLVVGSSAGITFAIAANDPAPPSIFGNFQSVSHAGAATGFLAQSVTSPATAVGETWSFGSWVRGSAVSGSVDASNAVVMESVGGTAESASFQLPVGEWDWTFANGSLKILFPGHTALRLGLNVVTPHAGSWRFDEAFLFKGTWRTFFGEPILLRVLRRSRVPKTGGNLIAGMGSFEADLNADGLADGWYKAGTLNIYSIEKDPANVAAGDASQKVVMANSTDGLLRRIKRGRFRNGETWRATVKVKTLGALTGPGGSIGFGIKLGTQTFDAAAVQATTTSFGTDLASFTIHSADVILAGGDRSELVIELLLSGRTGTIWLDDVTLTRISP